MRLATIAIDDGSTAAALLLDGGAAVVPGFPDVGALLRAGEDALARAAASHDPPVADARLLRPILSPGAVVCVGLNYRPHILEMGRELPEHPTYFTKLPRALADPDGEVELPEASSRVDYEGELVVVIGRGGRSIPVSDAWDAVAGLTLMNDVSMRDFQYRTLQWFAGKSWHRSSAVGPALVTLDELEPLGERELVTTVNGEERQRASLGDLVFDVPALVSDLSRIVALEPGDLIATGTPGGVGDAMRPQRYLEDGDVVDVSIEGIGCLRTTFRRC